MMNMTQDRPDPGFPGGGGPIADMGFGPGPGPGHMAQMMAPENWGGNMPPGGPPGGPANGPPGFSNSMMQPHYGPPMMQGSMMGPGGPPGPGGMMGFDDMMPPMGHPMHHQQMMPPSPNIPPGPHMPPSPMGNAAGMPMPPSPMGGHMPMVSSGGPGPGNHPSPGPPQGAAPLHHMQQMIPPVPGSSVPSNSMQPSSPMPQNSQMSSGSMHLPPSSSNMQSSGPMPPPSYPLTGPSGPMSMNNMPPQNFNGMRPQGHMGMPPRTHFDMAMVGSNQGMLRPGLPPHPMHMSPGPMGPPQGQPNPMMSVKVYPPNQPMVFNPANPNAPPIYPCGVCHKEVHDNDQAVLCESGCNFWFHRPCSGLTEAAFFFLTKDVYAEWVCDKCLSEKDIPLIKFKP